MATRSADGTFITQPDIRKGRDERAGQQVNGQPMLNPVMWTGGMMTASGGSIANPMGYPGYGSEYFGTYETYRWMLQHPVLRFVRAIATAAIMASTWEFERTEDSVPEEWVKQTEKTFLRIRPQLVNDFFVEGRDMGWAPGEPIWVYKDGLYDLDRVKPLLP